MRNIWDGCKCAQCTLARVRWIRLNKDALEWIKNNTDILRSD